MQTDFQTTDENDLFPEERRMQRCISLWLCRLLTIPKVKEKFIKKSDFGDRDISRFLRLSDEDGKLADGEYSAERAAEALKQLHAQLENEATAGLAWPDFLQANLRELQTVLKLERIEAEIYLLIVLKEKDPMLCDAFNLVTDSHRERTCGIIAHTPNVPLIAVSQPLDKGKRLREDVRVQILQTTNHLREVILDATAAIDEAEHRHAEAAQIQ